MHKKLKFVSSLLLTATVALTAFPAKTADAAVSTNGKLLVGYWHNFDNGTGIVKLSDVSTDWDVLNVSFGETSSDRAVLEFSPCYGTDAEFKKEVETVKSRGQDVVLSIGGQNGVVLVQTEEAKKKFIDSTIAIIDKYGFNGLDVDLESGISLDSNDTDFKNPTTPQIVNLIDAINTICKHYGKDFILSMAPETAYVQGGFSSYGNIWGAYLPIIYGVRDNLTYIHVQHYNVSSGNAGMDGVTYAQGTADYEVAMADMLLNGFPIANNPNNMFPALREDQVMIGIPATEKAAPSGGYISPTEMKKALDYILTGKSFGGKYKLSKESGYPGFRGLMTWSINWDLTNKNEFVTNYRPYFNSIVPPANTLSAATLSASTVSNGSFTLTAAVPSYNSATSYKLTENGKEVSTGALTAGSGAKNLEFAMNNKAAGTYKYVLELSDGSKTVSSNEVSITIKEKVAPTLKAATLTASAVENNSYTLTAKVPEFNLATSYKIFENDTVIASGSLTADSENEVTLTESIKYKAKGNYDYTVVLYDASNKTVTSNKVTISITSDPVLVWEEYYNYKAGDIVVYKGVTYRCTQNHTSLPGWTPDVIASLWQLA